MDGVAITITEREAFHVFVSLAVGSNFRLGDGFDKYEVSFLVKLKAAFPQLGESFRGEARKIWDGIPS